MAKKIYILLTVKVDSDGCISYDMDKFDDAEQARSEGRKRLDDWMSNNDMVEDCEADDTHDGCTCRIKTYNDDLVEATDTMSIAEFDYHVKEFDI